LVDRECGGQPFRSEDGNVLAAVNGEIYNHRDIRRQLGGIRWRSGSDCEVVLRLYESDPVSMPLRLRGMFAAVIYDANRGALVMLTDRLGIKPLFWARAGDRVLLASEIKALQGSPSVATRIDWRTALADEGLLGGMSLYERPPTSYYDGVNVVPAGTEVVVHVGSGTVASRRYWAVPGSEGAGRPAAASTRSYEEALVEAVRGCVTQSESDVGVFLSGGVDSGLVAAMGAKEREVRSFSVRTVSTSWNGDADGAARTAGALGLVHRELDFDLGGPWAPEEYLRVLYACETPLTGPEQLFKYELHRAIRATDNGVRVVLTGQGSDEFNGGYSATLGPPGEGWSGFMGTLRLLDEVGEGTAIRDGLQELVGSALRMDGLGRCVGRCDAVLWDRYVATKCRDLQMYNNWHEDRTAAAHGTESRVPFLDHDVVDAALGVVPDERERQFWDKAMLRAIARRWLPIRVAEAPKVPLFYGAGEWHARNLVLDVMLARDGELVRLAFDGPSAVLDAEAVISAMELARRSAGRNVAWVLLTRLVNLGLLDGLAHGTVGVPREIERELHMRTYAAGACGRREVEGWDYEVDGAGR
jgi:asparagine synthase (glutamine-hydrolysing)